MKPIATYLAPVAVALSIGGFAAINRSNTEQPSKPATLMQTGLQDAPASFEKQEEARRKLALEQIAAALSKRLNEGGRPYTIKPDDLAWASIRNTERVGDAMAWSDKSAFVLYWRGRTIRAGVNPTPRPQGGHDFVSPVLEAHAEAAPKVGWIDDGLFKRFDEVVRTGGFDPRALPTPWPAPFPTPTPTATPKPTPTPKPTATPTPKPKPTPTAKK